MNTKKWHGVEDLESRFGSMTTEYAKKLGLSRANLCDLEKGRKLITPERAARMAKKVGVPEKVLIQLAIQDSLHAARLKYTVELKAAS